MSDEHSILPARGKKSLFWLLHFQVLLVISLPLHPWIQTMADWWRNSGIEKVFALAKSHFWGDMERDFSIRSLFSYRHRNNNRDRKWIESFIASSIYSIPPPPKKKETKKKKGTSSLCLNFVISPILWLTWFLSSSSEMSHILNTRKKVLGLILDTDETRIEEILIFGAFQNADTPLRDLQTFLKISFRKVKEALWK